jgi:MFS family permease
VRAPKRTAAGEESPAATGYGPNFRLYAAGQAVSLVGDRIALIALVFLVIRLSHSYAPALALFYIARVVPTLAAGLFSGYIADSSDRRKVLIGCDILRCALLAVVPVLTSMDRLTVYPIVVLLYGLTVLFNATARAMLPDVVPENQLLGANSILTRIETFADLAYIAGGAMIATVDLSIPFYIDAATFAVSALVIFRMRIPSPRNVVAGTLREVGERIREGIAFLMSQAFLKWSTLSVALAPITIGGVFVVSPLYASRALAHSHGLIGPLHSGAFRFSVLEVGIGIGGLIGSVVAPMLSVRWPTGRVFALGMTGFGATVAALTFVTNMYVAILVMALSGVCNILFAIAGSTLTQALTPSEMRGRVMAARMTVIQGSLAVGSALGGFLLIWLPISTVWLILGFFMVAASGLVWGPASVRNQA